MFRYVVSLLLFVGCLLSAANLHAQQIVQVDFKKLIEEDPRRAEVKQQLQQAMRDFQQNSEARKQREAIIREIRARDRQVIAAIAVDLFDAVQQLAERRGYAVVLEKQAVDRAKPQSASDFEQLAQAVQGAVVWVESPCQDVTADIYAIVSPDYELKQSPAKLVDTAATKLGVIDSMTLVRQRPIITKTESEVKAQRARLKHDERQVAIADRGLLGVADGDFITNDASKAVLVLAWRKAKADYEEYKTARKEIEDEELRGYQQALTEIQWSAKQAAQAADVPVVLSKKWVDAIPQVDPANPQTKIKAAQHPILYHRGQQQDLTAATQQQAETLSR